MPSINHGVGDYWRLKQWWVALVNEDAPAGLGPGLLLGNRLAGRWNGTTAVAWPTTTSTYAAPTATTPIFSPFFSIFFSLSNCFHDRVHERFAPVSSNIYNIASKQPIPSQWLSLKFLAITRVQVQHHQ